MLWYEKLFPKYFIIKKKQIKKKFLFLQFLSAM